MSRLRPLLCVPLLLLTGSRCAGCGARGSSTPCPSCLSLLRTLPPVVDAAFHDIGVAARLVRSAKYGTWRGGGAVLAGIVAGRCHASPDMPEGGVDLITWVPADRRRRARRGVHLPEAVARALALDLGVPARPLLGRVRSRAQRGLGREERRRNVRGAFTWVAAPAPAPGSRVLVVDDIRTTGSTLDEACRVLEHHCLSTARLAVSGVSRRRPRAVAAHPVSAGMSQLPANSSSREQRSVPMHFSTSGERQYPGLTEPRPP